MNTRPYKRTLLIWLGIGIALLAIEDALAHSPTPNKGKEKGKGKATAPRATQDNRTAFVVDIVRASGAVTIDGTLDEAVWAQAKPARNFLNKWPIDTGQAAMQTEVRLIYDNDFMYVGAVCYDSDKHIIQTLKRDVGHWDSDGFAIVMDPVNQRTNGYIFAVNAGGAQMEGLVTANDHSRDWDAKWYSEVTRLPDRWIVEMAIPFKSLRFNENSAEWGVNFIRNDIKNNLL